MSTSKDSKQNKKPPKKTSAEQLSSDDKEETSNSQQNEKYSKSKKKKTNLRSTNKDGEPALTEEEEEVSDSQQDEELPKSNNDKTWSYFTKDGESEPIDEKPKDSSDFRRNSPVQEDRKESKPVSQPNKQDNNRKCSIKAILIAIPIIVVFGAVIAKACQESSNESAPSVDPEWRSKVDPGNYLSDTHQNMIRASLKPILDKHPSREYESISTLLVLSKNEDIAAQVARCVLDLVNKPGKKSTEIDLRSYTGDKTNLDSQLRSLLQSNNPAQAVLLRGIDHIPSEYILERLRLLFGYCDGENPVISNRLFLLTASSTADDDLRKTFKAQLPTEHDFIDALMSRISGHTIYLENDQRSIC